MSFFKKGSAKFLDSVIARRAANVSDVFRTEHDCVAFSQPQVLSGSRVTVENPDIAFLRPAFDDDPHPINSTIDDKTFFPRFDIK